MLINPSINPEQVGGKASQLCRLASIATVPPFFVIVFEAAAEVHQAEHQQVIMATAHNLFGDGLMAVRSSASLEDGSAASFAGMFNTVLGVRPGTLVKAVKNVADSLNDERVRLYRQAHRLVETPMSMAIIVQQMISSRVSGVCFSRTRGPDGDRTLVEACLGLGEALVSGRVDPDHYILSREPLRIIEAKPGYQREVLTCDTDPPTYRPVPFFLRNSQKLTEAEIIKIAKTGVELECKLGLDSADMEWAFQDSTLYVLQARPLVI